MAGQSRAIRSSLIDLSYGRAEQTVLLLLNECIGFYLWWADNATAVEWMHRFLSLMGIWGNKRNNKTIDPIYLESTKLKKTISITWQHLHMVEQSKEIKACLIWQSRADSAAAVEWMLMFLSWMGIWGIKRNNKTIAYSTSHTPWSDPSRKH